MSNNDSAAHGESDETRTILTELSRLGYRHLKSGDIPESISAFRQILDIEEDNHYALVGMGDAYRKKHSYREAEEFYKKCLESYPGNNYALFGLADCYRQQNQFANAIGIWEEYLQYDDGNVTVLTRVADAYRKLKNNRRSEELYQQVLDIEPKNAYALTGLGHLHYTIHNYDASLRYWDELYQDQGDNTDIRVLTSIGNCYRKLKSFYEGTSYFEEALRKEDSNFYALFGIADCHRGMHHIDKSLLYWNRILDMDPRNKIILTRAGDAYRHKQELDRAETYYKRALGIKYDIYAIIGLAAINIIHRKHEDAAHRLEGLLKKHFRNYRIYPLLMECYVFLEDRAQAIDLLRRFEMLGDVHPQIVQQMDEFKSRLKI